MIEQTVKVVSVEGDKAWVESLAQHGCARCEAGQGCGGGIFAKLFGDKQFRMEINNTLSVKNGEDVVIGIPENSVTTASFWAYLLPLMGLLFGAIIGQYLDAPNEEIWTLALSFLGAGLALLFGMIQIKTQQFKNKYTPVMVRKKLTVEQFEPSSL